LKGIAGGLNLVQGRLQQRRFAFDVFIPRGAWLHDHGKFPRSLLRNNCDGHLHGRHRGRRGSSATTRRRRRPGPYVNNDGFLDLFVGNEIDRGSACQWPDSTKKLRAVPQQPGRDLHRGRRGHPASGRREMIKAAVWGDYDNDGWQRPLRFPSSAVRTTCFRNLGAQTRRSAGGSRTSTVKAGVAEPLVSFHLPGSSITTTTAGWTCSSPAIPATLPNIVREYVGQKETGERRAAPGSTTITRTERLPTFRIKPELDGPSPDDGSETSATSTTTAYLDMYLGTGAPPLTTLVPNRMFPQTTAARAFQDVDHLGRLREPSKKGTASPSATSTRSGKPGLWWEVMGGAYSSDKYWTSIYKKSRARQSLGEV